MQNRKSQKLNNKGFSFLLVIVAMSFVAILVAIMLLLAYQNFQMKHTGLKSEDNFYTAEQVLDEIKAGLQSDISASVSDAYAYVLERYSETEGQDATRNWYFQTKYVDALRARLLGNAATATYNLDLIKSYVQKADDNGTVLIEMDGTQSTLVTNYSNGVTLKGLKVTYTDNRGYVSIISTDLRLAIPAIDFTQTSSSPDLLEYCVVADEGIIVKGGVTGTPEILSGNVYAGDNGLAINSSARLLVNDSERAIFKDGIDMESGASFSFSGNAMWTNSIDVLSGAVSANGNIFVKDDMTLAGANSSAALTGRYYGFSNPELVKGSNVYREGYIAQNTPAAELSSAIVVNGRNTSLNLANLQSIFIAGNSYINAKLGVPNENPLSVQMGESISVKGNQLAYLAPESALVITNGGNSSGGNPIIDLPNDATVSLNVSKRLRELGGRTLASLGFDADDCQVYYRPGIAYVYMKFDSDVQAANYYNAYYKTDVNKYKDLFLSNFSMNPDAMTNVTLNGSVFEEVENTVVEQEDIHSAQAEANGYQDMFFAFCKKLIPTYTSLSNEEKNKTVFENIIEVDELERYLASYSTGGKFTYTTPGTGLEAILVRGNYTITSADSNTRLILATGNVTLDADFDYKGIVVCGGSFTMGKGATLTATPDEVSAVFQCVYCEGGATVAPEEMSPMNFFTEGKDYVLDGIASGVVSGSAGSLIELSDIIIYENWKKQ